MSQGDNDEILHNLAVTVRCGTVVLRQAPEEIWNQAKGRADITLYSSLPRSMLRFDLRFATLFPADEALVRVFVGHTWRVNDCAFSPDGKQILSVSDDRTLRLWDVASGETVRVFECPWPHDPEGCAFSPDGKQALSASPYSTLLLWDIASGKTVHVIKEYIGYGYAFSPDGKQALNASKDDTLRLWDVASGETVRVFVGHTKRVIGCAFSPDGKQVLSVSDDHTLRLWNAASGETVRVIEEPIDSCAFSPDGHQVLSKGYDELHLFDVVSEKIVRDFKVNAYVKGGALSSDGRWVLSASNDKALRQWNVTTGEMMRVFEGHSAEVNSCAFSPDGLYAISVSGDLHRGYDCTMRLWDLTNIALLRSFEGHSAEVNSCAFNSDGHYALSASSDSTLRLWDVASGKTIRIFQGHTGKVAGCTFSPDGQKALSIGGEMRLWDVAKGKTIYSFEKTYSHVSGSGCMISPDGQKALSIGESSIDSLELWDMATGEMIHDFEIRRVIMESYIMTGTTCGGAFSPDGRQVVYGAKDGTLRLFDVARGTEVCVLRKEGSSAHSKRCAFSPSGRQVLSAGDDLLLWDLAKGAVAQSFEGHSGEINGCGFSPNGRYALSASDDCTLRVWNIASGRELARWTTNAPLLCCAFGPDNETVIAGDNMGGLHFLSIVT